MSLNHRLDRRHDISKGERLPERFSRVLDMENYWDGISRVLNNESDAEALQGAQEARERAAMELAEKKSKIKVGSVVMLRWSGIQFCRVEAVKDDAVKLGGNYYGMELVQVPSEHLLAMIKAEVEGDI